MTVVSAWMELVYNGCMDLGYWVWVGGGDVITAILPMLYRYARYAWVSIICIENNDIKEPNRAKVSNSVISFKYWYFGGFLKMMFSFLVHPSCCLDPYYSRPYWYMGTRFLAWFITSYGIDNNISSNTHSSQVLRRGSGQSRNLIIDTLMVWVKKFHNDLTIGVYSTGDRRNVYLIHPT